MDPTQHLRNHPGSVELVRFIDAVGQAREAYREAKGAAFLQGTEDRLRVLRNRLDDAMTHLDEAWEALKAPPSQQRAEHWPPAGQP
jgi:hypothetical protein